MQIKRENWAEGAAIAAAVIVGVPLFGLLLGLSIAAGSWVMGLCS